MKLYLGSRVCPLSGEVGLCSVNMRQLDYLSVPTSGDFLAHDLIEHINGPEKIGSTEDELQALGVLWHTRGRWGGIQRYGQPLYTAEQALAFDLENLFWHHLHTDHIPDENTPKVRTSCMEELESIILFGREQINKEFRNYANEIDPRFLERYLLWAYRNMIIGYRKADRRYGTDYRSYDLFWNTVEVCDRMLKDVYAAGQRFALHINKRHCIVRYEEIE